MDINKLQYIKEIIRNADQVLIGIGEDWNLFEKHKAESEAESDYLSVLSLEESSQKKESVMNAYESLYELVKDKPHFVVTMNADDVIYQTGFAEEQIVTPCGSVHMLQCRQHILERFETAPLFDRMKDNMRNTGRLWEQEDEFPLRCPVCGLPLKLNTIETKGYLEEGYLPQWKVYTGWLTRTLNKKLCILELGVSFDHPSVIRFPFEKTAFYNNKATMIRVNERFYQFPQEMGEKGISVRGNAVDFVHRLKEV